MIFPLGLVAVCVAWLLPGHYFPWTGFQQDAVAAAGAFLLAVAAIFTPRGEWPARLPAAALAAVLLAAVPLLQKLLGLLPFLSDAAIPAAYLVGFAMAIVSGLQLTNANPLFLPALFATFGAAAFLSVGLGLAQWLNLGPYGFLENLGAHDRVFANFTQPNHLASLLGLGAASVIWAYETRRVGSAVATFSLVFLGWGLVMTQSRVGWMTVLLFSALTLLYRRRLRLRTTPVGVAASVGGFAVMVLAWNFANRLLQSNVEVIGIADRMSAGYRLVHWQTLWDALLRSPWVGYGWLQVPRAQLVAIFEHPPTFEQLGSAHNQLLDLLIWNGLPLGLVAIGAIFRWSFVCIRRCHDVDSFALLAGLSVLFAHSMVEFPLQYAYFLFPAGLMVGGIAAKQPVSPETASPRIGRPLFAAIIVLLGTLLAIVVDEYLEVEEQVRRVRLREMGVVEQAGYLAVVPEVFLLDGPREYDRMWLSEQHPGMSEAEIEWLRSVAQRYPTPPALIRYAVAAGLNGRSAEARRALEALCRLHLPRHCDQSRLLWDALKSRLPGLAEIPFPPTPSR